MVQTFHYGYVKPSGTKSDDEIVRDPDAVPVYEKWFQRLENGVSYSEVADGLNSSKVERTLGASPSSRVIRRDATSPQCFRVNKI